MSKLDLETKVEIPIGDDVLEGEFILPKDSLGIVVFAHGSGSSGLNPRSLWVAQALHERRIGTLLFDLLSREEEVIDSVTRHLRLDIPLLAQRLVAAVRFVENLPSAKGLPIGFYGASTGGGAVLEAAAHLQGEIAAIVVRGGRFERTTDVISKVSAPTLFIVGEQNEEAIQRSNAILPRLAGKTQLALIPEDPLAADESMTLEAVAKATGDWFARELS